jgi:hypothetical protein
VIRTLFAAFEAGDADAVARAFADDVVWHFPGRAGRLAGDHRGPAAVFAFLAKVPELTGGTFRLDLVDVLANDRFGVAMFRGTASRDDKRLDNPTCLTMRIESGKVVELWEFVWDLYHVDDFWS